VPLNLNPGYYHFPTTCSLTAAGSMPRTHSSSASASTPRRPPPQPPPGPHRVPAPPSCPPRRHADWLPDHRWVHAGVSPTAARSTPRARLRCHWGPPHSLPPPLSPFASDSKTVIQLWCSFSSLLVLFRFIIHHVGALKQIYLLCLEVWLVSCFHRLLNTGSIFRLVVMCETF
jgi:hypothetical protein